MIGYPCSLTNSRTPSRLSTASAVPGIIGTFASIA